MALTLAILAIRLAIINVPGPEAGERYCETGFVFDEAYYVKAAREMLAGSRQTTSIPRCRRL